MHCIVCSTYVCVCCAFAFIVYCKSMCSVFVCSVCVSVCMHYAVCTCVCVSVYLCVCVSVYAVCVCVRAVRGKQMVSGHCWGGELLPGSNQARLGTAAQMRMRMMSMRVVTGMSMSVRVVRGWGWSSLWWGGGRKIIAYLLTCFWKLIKFHIFSEHISKDL